MSNKSINSLVFTVCLFYTGYKCANRNQHLGGDVLKKSSFQNISILAVIVFSIIVIGITVFMTLKNTAELTEILEESIKSGLISTSLAARSLLDIDAFDSYNSAEDIMRDSEHYYETLEHLRHLQRQIGVEYIYALKLIDGKYHFIFDTDEEEDTLFDEYEISTVHERAFLGEESAGIMNVIDDYGSFNTGAVPIWRGGRVIGIISTDIADVYIEESSGAATRNSTLLIVTIVITMCVLIAIVALLMQNVKKMQDKLFRMANFDVLTGLPNRQYLISYLDDISKKALRNGESFAFLLIDLDNFKKVNDGAGHDAGDELLRHFAVYLDSIHGNSKSFRPPAGALNVSARIGGDEFVQIVPGIATTDAAEMMAKRLLENFSSQTIDRFVEKYQVGMSVGVALFPYHTENFNVLIKYADIAMYNAKKNGKNTYSIYNDEMSQGEPDTGEAGTADRRQFRR